MVTFVQIKDGFTIETMGGRTILILTLHWYCIAVLFCVRTTADFLHFLYAIALLKMNVVDYP